MPLGLRYLNVWGLVGKAVSQWRNRARRLVVSHRPKQGTGLEKHKRLPWVEPQDIQDKMVELARSWIDAGLRRSLITGCARRHFPGPTSLGARPFVVHCGTMVCTSNVSRAMREKRAC